MSTLPLQWLAIGIATLGTAAAAPSVQIAAGAPAALAAADLLTPPPSGGGSYQANIYKLDDGSTDQTLGLTLGGTMCWLQTFDTRPLAEYDVITEIQVGYGFPQNPGFCVPDGTPVTACLWEDPTDDGDPSDALLLLTKASTVQNRDTQILNSIPIAATTVRGRFFAGVFLTHFINQFPASRDLNTQSLGRAFFLGTLTGGSFNPSNLQSLSHTQIFSLDNAGPGIATSVWRIRALGSDQVLTSYCVSKLNSVGCLPAISAIGVPQASAFAGFVVRGSNVRNNKSGLLFYGVNGRSSFPFQGGFLCVKSPVKRTPSRSSGGSAAPLNDCSGVFEIDMTAFARGFYGGTPLPALGQAGTLVDCQWWGRDPGFPAPNNVTLTDGLEYSITP